MASQTTSDMIVAISIVALLVFLSALRKAVRRGEWSKTATLAVVIAGCTQTSINIVVTYLGTWQRVKNIYLNVPWVWPWEWHQVWRVLSFALGAVAAVVFLRRVKRRDVSLNTPRGAGGAGGARIFRVNTSARRQPVSPGIGGVCGVADCLHGGSSRAGY